MDKYEKNLIDKVGRREPFKVPQDYFDHFAADLMSRLPQQPTAAEHIKPQSHATVVSLRKHWRPLAAAASTVVVVGLSTILYFNHNSATSGRIPTTEQEQVATNSQTLTGNDDIDGLIDECADYTMMDNEDMYAYVSGY